MHLKELCTELTNDIKQAYEQGVTMDQAERLAAKFLYGQIQVSEALKVADLDSRMKKTGVKAIKSSLYLYEATKSDKKPSDVMLGALVDKSAETTAAQDALDTSEVDRNQLENFFSIFREGHIYFRGISKGRFE